MFLSQLWLLKGIYSLYGKHVHDVHQLVRENHSVKNPPKKAYIFAFLVEVT